MDYFLQRHAGTSGGSNANNNSTTVTSRALAATNERSNAINRRLVAEHMAELLENASIGTQNAPGAITPGSPVREEAFGFRRGNLAHAAALGMMLRDDAAYAAFLTAKLQKAKTPTKVEHGAVPDLLGNKDLETFDLAFSDTAAWNNELLHLPLLPGVYTSRRRHDSDKQEVLAQVTELDVLDMISIVATCEFALCIYYARSVFLRMMQCSRLFMSSAVMQRRSNLSPSKVKFPSEATELPIYNMISIIQPNLLCNFLRNAFKQYVIVFQQSDRLFPMLSFGTIQGNVSCKLPPIAPFVPRNRILFGDLLCQLDSVYFKSSLSTIASEDISHVGLLEIRTVVLLLVHHSLHIGFNFTTTTTSNSEQPLSSGMSPDGLPQISISSSLKALQDRVLSKVGVSLAESPLDKTANELLGALIEYSMGNMERALSSKYEGHDWIAGSLQRANSNVEALKGHLVAPDSLDSSSSPYILFSYFILRTVLCAAAGYVLYRSTSLNCTSAKAELQDQSPGLQNLSSLEEGLFLKQCCLNQLASPEILSRLLKLSGSLNDSLRFCTYDLAAHILSLVNLQLQQLHYNSIHKVAALTRQGSSQLADIYLQHLSELRLKSPLTQITAAEYYVSVAKEKILLCLFGTRMKIEAMEKALYTRYTRSVGSLLFQWYLLRKQLNLGTSNYMKAYMQQSLRNPVGLVTINKELDGFKHEQFIRIVQTSSTSITITWQLSQIDNELAAQESGLVEISDNFNLYITTQSHVSMENAVLILPNMKLKGTFRIDDLEPDTLYEVSIHRDHYSMNEAYQFNSESLQTKEPSLSLLVSTDAEATFGFQADNLSPNLIVSSSSPLTLRNHGNKKWSTARANMRLTSGVHRWDVHVDRCISKNIFVGVATREARLDNYVGCDIHGWAFLANKAVWHNKSKSKTYGELFRSGDTVTVILDLDMGTLSFCLNDRPLGVAVEGLEGPLYPAFSLYNEDDQITVAQVRSVHDNPSSYGSFMGESALDRLDMLRNVMQYFTMGHHAYQTWHAERDAASSALSPSPSTPSPSSLYSHEDSRSLHSFLSDEMLEELLARYRAWQEGICIRSFAHHGQMLTIHIHHDACEAFCGSQQQPHPLTLHKLVRMEQRAARVIGVGHGKVWFRYEEDGELTGLSYDLLLHMLDKALIVPYGDAEPRISGDGEGSIVNLVQSLSGPFPSISMDDDGTLTFTNTQALFQELLDMVSFWSVFPRIVRHFDEM
ncbi:hypothetical protein EON64_07085 [archaeon]|nr:MAG: hypothetical protein EON64_07085 [archaeon]